MESLPPASPPTLAAQHNDAWNDKAFFFEATQTLCSSLLPENAIAAFYDYLTRFVPLTGFLLASTPLPLTNILVVAHASDKGVVCPFERLTLSREQQKLSKKLDISNPAKFREYMLTRVDDFSRFLAGSNRWRLERPILFPRLVRENAAIGSALFATRAPLEERQLHLLRGLEGPLCLALSNMLQHWELRQSREEILRDNQRLRHELEGRSHLNIIGADRGLAKVMEKVRQVAPVNVPVLITGETGTGKEEIAQALHELSHRREQPFVVVNCGAMPPSLIDSALFGHVKGSFTGATENHKGYFERAEGGTLFLDEIGELPLEAQARLLRALEMGEIEKVGGTSPAKVRIRLLAATNRDLGEMARTGQFRADLWYRLNVVGIHLPPLRERKEDIPLLVRHLLQKSAAAFGIAPPALAPGEAERLLACDWPGNVRELRNVLEEALACCGSGPLRVRERLPDAKNGAVNPRNGVKNDDVGLDGESPTITADASPTPDKAAAHPANTTHGTRPTYDDVTRTYFLQMLEDSRWRVAGKNGAAAKAGLKPGTFRFKCGKLGILLRPSEAD